MTIHTYLLRFTFYYIFSHLICGQSGCGKSTLAGTLVRYRHEMFDPVPAKVIWIYSERVSIPPDLLDDNLIDECYQGYESYQFLRERLMANRAIGTLCILDDALSSSSLIRDIDRIFFELGHHSNTSLIMISQELFHKHTAYRTACKQLSHLWLFPSKRSATDIHNLARQIAPSNYKYIIKYVLIFDSSYLLAIHVHFLK